jgi:hypothetical protein
MVLSLTGSTKKQKAALPPVRQPGCLPRIQKPVAFRPRLTAGLAFSYGLKHNYKKTSESVMINYEHT